MTKPYAANTFQKEMGELFSDFDSGTQKIIQALIACEGMEDIRSNAVEPNTINPAFGLVNTMLTRGFVEGPKAKEVLGKEGSKDMAFVCGKNGWVVAAKTSVLEIDVDDSVIAEARRDFDDITIIRAAFDSPAYLENWPAGASFSGDILDKVQPLIDASDAVMGWGYGDEGKTRLLRCFEKDYRVISGIIVAKEAFIYFGTQQGIIPAKQEEE